MCIRDSQNTLAVVVPAGDYETEERLLKRLSAFPQVDTALGLANVEVKDGYVLTDALTPRQFSELTDMDMEVCRLDVYKRQALAWQLHPQQETVIQLMPVQSRGHRMIRSRLPLTLGSAGSCWIRI